MVVAQKTEINKDNNGVFLERENLSTLSYYAASYHHVQRRAVPFANSAGFFTKTSSRAPS